MVEFTPIKPSQPNSVQMARNGLIKIARIGQ